MRIPQINRQQCSALIATALLTFTTGVTANPVGEQVIQGQAGFVRNGSNLIITQGTQRVIINWQDFSNANGDLTKFIQPNSSSAALNRVISGNPSALLGDLEANGHIYLINPNGIVVGAGANINTQSFIASTLDVADADFMNGGDLNFVGDSQKTIENLGTINGGNGDVFLIAKHVDNSGTIKSEGHVGLAGGNDVLLKASGDDRLAVRVTDKDGRVDQSGLIEATKIELRTAGNNPYALAINHEGISRATSAVNKEGRIILFAEGGTTKADGTLDASAPVDGDGGFIETSGTHVKITDTVKIDTSSVNGETGTWLIDPEEIEIHSTGTIAGASVIAASTIEGNLNSTNVDITSNNALGGNGNISVNENINSASTNNLTMNAGTGGNINVNQSINIGGDINLNAGNGADGIDGNNALENGGLSQAATNGADGQDGGIIQVNAALTSNSGDINLRGGSGGRGGKGGDGDTNDLPLAFSPFAIAAGADGGQSGQGGFVSVDADITAVGNVSIMAGSGNAGGVGGIGRRVFDESSGPELGAANAGDGGVGGSGGNTSINAQINAADLVVQSGAGGLGGQGGTATGTAGAVLGFSGTGGKGGNGGSVFLNTSQMTANTGQINAAGGNVGGSAGSFSVSPSVFPNLNGGDGGNGGAAGSITLAQALTLNGSGDFSFNTSAAAVGGAGGSGFGTGTNGNAGIAAANSEIQLSHAISTSGNLIFNSGGNITGAGQLSANNITLNANAMNAAIGSAAQVINTNATGIITADANNGNGGIFLSNQGDLQIGDINSGTGDATLTAVDGSLSSGTSLINFAGTNLIFTTTEDANNNTAGDRNIQIGSGGINATNTNLTLTSVDDVIIDGAINAASVTATAGDGKDGVGTFAAIDDPNPLNGGRTGMHGERGGDISITSNGSVITHGGDLTLTAGDGGRGAAGESSSVNVNGVNGDLFGTGGNSGGTGGNGGAGGSITINGALNSQQHLTLRAGVGGDGGLAGNGNGFGGDGGGDGMNASVFGGDGGNSGGSGGDGGAGGSLSVGAALSAQQSLTITAATGGLGGDGGFGLINGGGNGAVRGTGGGDGGNGGAGGSLSVGAALSAQQSLIMTAGTGREGGFGDGGSLSGDGDDGIAGAEGALTGSQIDATSTTGSITVDGEVNADAGSSVSLLAGGNTAMQTLTFTTPQDFNLTGAGNLSLKGYGFSSANNFSTQDGDISINSGASNITLSGTVNSGNGDLSVTAGGFFNTSTLSGNDITLKHTGNPFTSGLQKTGAGAVEIQATGKLNVDTANGSSAIINQTGDLQIGTLTGGNAFGLSGGTSTIALTVQDGDLNMDNTSSITNYNSINFTAHNGSIDTGTASINVAVSQTSPSVIHKGVMTLTTTEDATNDTAGDHNITIGSGGIIDGNITLSSTDDVVVNGVINSDSFSATSGNGAFGVFVSGQNGSDGERGGNININSSIQTNAGAINLTAGRGGDGSRTDVNGGIAGDGATGGSITVNGALTATQDLSQSSTGAITVNAGDGGYGNSVGFVLGTTGTAGNGGQGGDININGDVTSNIDISLNSGDGELGGAGSDISGVGGVGGNGGNIDVQGKLAAEQDINVTSGFGANGGVGTINASTDGTGGNGGNAGNITLRDTVTAQRHVGLRTRVGGDGGEGRNSGGSPGGSTVGTGGNGGNGGVMDLRGAISTQGDVQLIVSDAGGSGNVDGVDGSDGQIIGSQIDITATTGNLTVDGEINAGVNDVNLTGGNLTLSKLITANNISLNATAADAAIGSSGGSEIQFNATGIVTANASNGAGGIFLSKQGDFDISNLVLNTGTGAAELTAIDGNLTSGASLFNFTGANLTLSASDTTAADNNTPAGITIGTGGINSNDGNVTLNAADDVLLNGQINAGSGNVMITADNDSLDTFADTDGSILDVAGLDNNVDIIANELTLNAGEQIGGRVINNNTGEVDNALNLQVTQLTANASNDHISVTEVDDINLGNIISEATNGWTVLSAGGDIERVSAGTTINVRQLSLTTTGLNSSIGGAGQLRVENNSGIRAVVDAGNGSGDVNLYFEDDLILGSNINAGTGNVDIETKGGIGDSGASVNITGATLDILSSDPNPSDVYLKTNIDRLIVDVDSGLHVREADNIDLGDIDVDFINLTSSAGSITQNSGIIKGTAMLSAQSLNASIGTEAAPLVFSQVLQIDATANNGTGGIYIDTEGFVNFLGLDAGTGDVVYQNAFSVSNSTSNRIIGNSVTLANINAAINTSNFNRFDAGTLHLNNIGGDVTINEFDGLALGTIDLGTNNLTLGSTGSITSNSSGVTANNLSLTTTGTDASIGAAGDAINTTLSGNLTANATNGTGGVYVSESGTLNIANVNAGSGDAVFQAGTDLVLESGSAVTTSATGNIVLAAGNDFHNDSGSNAPLNLGTGRFVVYSERPDDNRNDIAADTNAIAHDFVQYNTAFNSNDVIPTSLPADNGFVYSVQPVLTGVAVTVNNQTINYGETISNILDTDFTVVGGTGASYEVGGIGITAADFELADASGVTIDGSDVELNLANAVAISNAGFAAAGAYTDGIEAGVKAGSALASQGIALSGAGDLTVNQRNLNVTVAADNKVYDATDVAVLSLGADDRLVGDILTIDAGTSTFDDKNVGVGKTVTIAGATLSGADAGNYNFIISNAGTLSADITQADLVVNGAAAQNKIYDQAITATVTGAAVTALLTDTVSLTLDSANFSDKNAGTNKAVAASYSISGTDAGNYNLIQPVGLTADITQRTLNATLTANDKTYDATIAATGTLGDDRIAGDVLTLAGTSNFITKDAGTNKTVTATGLVLSGTDAGNYVLASTSVNDLADINRANLTVSGAAAQNKVYDTTTIATVTGGSVTALGSDVLTLGVANANFNDKNVGTGKTITTNFGLTGADAANYNVIQPTTLTADITAADLIVNGAVAQNKVYDQTRAAIVTGASVTALGSDVLVLGAANGLFDDKNAGAAKAVATSFGLTGTDAGNYNLIQPTTLTADVTARTLNATLTANDKVYDATTIATGLFGDDRIAGDVFAITGASNFDTKDVGANKTVTATGLSLAGTDAGNYVLASTSVNDLADVTQAALIALANDDSKVFDGVAYSGGNGVSYAGFVGGENDSVLDGTLNYSGTSQGATNPGGYAITPGGLTSPNYAITFVDGGLTINAATSGGGSGGGNGPNGTFNSFLSIVNDGIKSLNTEGSNFVALNAGSLANALYALRVEIGDAASEVPPLTFLSWAASRGFLEEDGDDD